MNIKYVPRNWAFHGEHSGYEKLEKWITPSDPIKEFYIPYQIAKQIAGFAKHQRYTSDSFQKEYSAFIDIIFSRPDILHFFYADHDFHFLGNLSFLSKPKIVATFHHPPMELEQRWEHTTKKFLRKIDGAICMGTSQINYLEPLIGKGKVKWIPHGIDTNFFCPSNVPSETNRLLVVGVSHRDFETLTQALLTLKARNPKLKCTVVVPKEFQQHFHHLPWLQFFDGKIDDHLLLEFYQKSTCTLLILNDCTASNTLLEAISVGSPLVVTDIGSVKNYVDSNCAMLVPPFKPVEIVKSCELLLSKTSLRRELGILGSRRAKMFDWSIVAKETMAFYQEISYFHKN